LIGISIALHWTGNEIKEHGSTWNAGVGDFEVGLELGVAAGCLLEQRVRHSQGAPPSAGAAHRDDVDDVRVAADEAEVRSDAASDAHATVSRLDNHYHLELAAFRLEHFRQTVVLRIYNDATHQPAHARFT